MQNVQGEKYQTQDYQTKKIRPYSNIDAARNQASETRLLRLL